MHVSFQDIAVWFAFSGTDCNTIGASLVRTVIGPLGSFSSHELPKKAVSNNTDQNYLHAGRQGTKAERARLWYPCCTIVSDRDCKALCMQSDRISRQRGHACGTSQIIPSKYALKQQVPVLCWSVGPGNAFQRIFHVVK